MSRGIRRVVRPLAVWLAVTAAAGAAATAVPVTWSSVGGGSSASGAADAVVAVCGTGLALAMAWLWVVTTATVVELVLTRQPSTPRGTARRLVLLACGAAVVAGTTAPAVASGGDGRELLAGLTLPERAVAPADARAERHPQATPDAPSTAADDTYVVRPGDSLWSIARAHPGPGIDVDRRWRAIWAANREVVGDDPDLILPGQALRLPGTHHQHEDGAR